MANGSHKQGPAVADRLREANAKYERFIQRKFDELPPYRAEEDSESEITGSWKGVHAKGLPSRAMLVFGYALAFALAVVSIGWAAVQVINALK